MIEKKSSFLINFLIFIGCFTLFSEELKANKIGILPAIIQKDSKDTHLTKIDIDYQKEFAKLSRDIMEKNFYADVKTLNTIASGSKKIQDFCMENRLHYIVQDELFLSKKYKSRIHSKVVNCSTNSTKEKESILDGFVVGSIERHILSLWKQIPKKERKRDQKQFSPIDPNLSFFIDSSGPYSIEQESIQKFISSQKKETLESSYAINSNARLNLNSRGNQIRFSGDSSTDRILSYFNRFVSQTYRNKDGSYKFLFIHPKHFSQGKLEFTTALNLARQNLNQTYVILPFNATIQDRNVIQRIVNSTGSFLLESMAYRQIGTANGDNGYLVLKGGYLYFSQKSPKDPEFDLKNSNRFYYDTNPNPYQMIKFYEEKSGVKIIQSGEIHTNTIDVIGKTIESIQNPQNFDSVKILCKVHGTAFWAYIPKKIKPQRGERKVLETYFSLNPSTTSGIINQSSKSKLHPANYDYPKLLEYNPNEIKSILQKYNLDTLKVYIPVYIEDVE